MRVVECNIIIVDTMKEASGCCCCSDTVSEVLVRIFYEAVWCGRKLLFLSWILDTRLKLIYFFCIL